MALILVGFALIALIDLIPLIRHRSGHGIATFLLIYAAALILAVLESKKVGVPSIMILLGEMLEKLGLRY